MLANILLYTVFPLAAMIVGSIFAAFRPPGPRVRSYTQHFAAGVVFAALAGEVLPELTHSNPAPVTVVAGFAAGVAVMLSMRRLTEGSTESAGEGAGGPESLLIAVGLDLFIDGLLVGLGIAAGQNTGLLLTVALTVEILFLGLATSAAQLRSGASRRQVIGAAFLLVIPILAGAVIGGMLLAHVSPTLFEALLAFALAALLYLVTEELLTEAHEVPETAVATAMFFAGFLIIFLIELIV